MPFPKEPNVKYILKGFKSFGDVFLVTEASDSVNKGMYRDLDGNKSTSVSLYRN